MSAADIAQNDFLKFDEMFKLTVPTSYLQKFEKLAKASKKRHGQSSIKVEKLFAVHLKELVEELLGQSRIASVVLRNRPKSADNQENTADHSFFLGLIFGDRWAEPIMRGPPANTEEGKKFRNDFGEMSEIRKFADNSLCESVCWIELDESGYPSDTLNNSIGEQYMNFICYKKLSLPEGSLQKLFDWPNKWVSAVPRAMFPPTFLHNSYQALAKHLRSISLMSLGIVGVNCVSSHLRDTEPFRLNPVRPLWRRSKNGHFYQRLNVDEKIPTFTPSIKVFITLERTGKWGRDLEKVKSYKTACYVELANEFLTNHKTNVIAMEDSALILLNGVVFRLVIVHDNELRQYQEISTEFSTDSVDYQATVNAHEATVCQQLQSVSLRFSAFGETCQVAKRWLAASNFSGHINDFAIELLVAKGFTEPTGRSIDSISPMTVTSGFLQFLNLLSSHNFLAEPVFVDTNDGLNDQDREEILQEFLMRRPVLPCICICTPEDRSGTRYTTACPEPIVMCRLVKIAQQAMNTITGMLKQHMPVNYGQLRVDDSSVYDFVIRLQPEKSTRFAPNNKQPINSVEQSSLHIKGGRRAMAIPVVDFDLTARLVEEYRTHLGKYAIFFYDTYHADRIAVLYRKNFRLPNKKELADCAEFFKCMPDPIQLHAQFKKQLSKLSAGIILPFKDETIENVDSD